MTKKVNNVVSEYNIEWKCCSTSRYVPFDAKIFIGNEINKKKMHFPFVVFHELPDGMFDKITIKGDVNFKCDWGNLCSRLTPMRN